MITFTEAEMRTLLSQIGYKIKEIHTWDYAYDEDEGGHYKAYKYRFIVTKEGFEPTKELLEDAWTFIEREFGIEAVFRKEFVKRIGRLF